MIGIYAIINKINNKKYIGQSVDIKRRWNQHKTDLNKNKHKNVYLQRAWNKYGKNNFKFVVIKELKKKSELNKEEKKIIKIYNSNNKNYGYNLTDGGDNATFSKESIYKLKISRRGKGTKFTVTDIKHIKLALYCLMDRKEISKMFDISVKNLTEIATGKCFDRNATHTHDFSHELVAI